MSNTILELINVSKSYIGGYLALSEVSLTLDAGGRICILGEANSGKTTLMKIIAGLETSGSGKILFNNMLIDDIRHRNIGYYTLAEMPNFQTVFKILAYPLKIRKLDNIKNRIMKHAEKFCIENLLRLKIKDLNQMQKISVAIARLFIIERDIYLLDNPLELLPICDRSVMALELKRILNNINGAVILATDSLIEAETFGFEHNAVLAYSVLTRTDYLWKLRSNPPNLAVAYIMDKTASVLTRLTLDKFHQKSCLKIDLPPTIGEFTSVGFILYSDDYIIGNGELHGIIIDVVHRADKILYDVDIEGEKLIIGEYAQLANNYKIGDKIQFKIKSFRPFDLLSEQSILKYE